MLSEVISLPVQASLDTHRKIDVWAKANSMTVTYADWHPKPEYRMFKTGTLLSRNSEYPSGLILINQKGIPYVFCS